MSVLGGKPPFVDRWLKERGALPRRDGAGGMGPVVPRRGARRWPSELRLRGRELAAQFIDVAVSGR